MARSFDGFTMGKIPLTPTLKLNEYVPIIEPIRRVETKHKGSTED